MTATLRRPLLFFICYLFALKGSTQSFMTNIPGRHVVSLNGNWQAIIDWYDYQPGEIATQRFHFHQQLLGIRLS